MRHSLSTVVVLALLPALAAAPAAAEDLEVEKATALFNAGRQLADEGRYGEACERFEQSLALSEGIGTRFNLADCWEHLGRTASAQALFTAVAVGAGQQGQLERAGVARERAAALEARVARLAIEVETVPDSRLTVRRNGAAVPESEWGRAVPVDPGVYRVEASAPGRVSFSRAIQVPATASVVLVTVPKLEPHIETDEEREQPTPRKPIARPSHTVPPAPAAERKFGAGSIGLTALGVAGLATGTVFFLKYNAANEKAEDICPKSVTCPRSQIDRHSELVRDAKVARAGTFIGYGAGGAALTLALITYLIPSSSRPADDSQRQLALEPLLGPGAAGMLARTPF